MCIRITTFLQWLHNKHSDCSMPCKRYNPINSQPIKSNNKFAYFCNLQVLDVLLKGLCRACQSLKNKQKGVITNCWTSEMQHSNACKCSQFGPFIKESALQKCKRHCVLQLAAFLHDAFMVCLTQNANQCPPVICGSQIMTPRYEQTE